MARIQPDRRIAPRPEDPELRGRRSDPRAFLVLPASTEALSGHQRVTLVDVSRMGAQLKGHSLPAGGKCMILRCGSVDTFGTIVWSKPGRCGMQFDEPVEANELRELRALSEAENESELTAEEREAAADWLSGLAR
jgi:hypothetical protein